MKPTIIVLGLAIVTTPSFSWGAEGHALNAQPERAEVRLIEALR